MIAKTRTKRESVWPLAASRRGTFLKVRSLLPENLSDPLTLPKDDQSVGLTPFLRENFWPTDITRKFFVTALSHLTARSLLESWQVQDGGRKSGATFKERFGKTLGKTFLKFSWSFMNMAPLSVLPLAIALKKNLSDRQKTSWRESF